MRPHKRTLLLASTVLAWVVPLGCDTPKPDVSASTEEATVTGSVKIDGKLAGDGDIIFDPSNYQRQAPSRSAPLKDGSYTIKTLVGVNTVKLGGTAAQKSPILQSVKRSFDVAAGQNTFDLELSAK